MKKILLAILIFIPNIVLAQTANVSNFNTVQLSTGATSPLICPGGGGWKNFQIREYGNVLYDPADPNPARRYKWWYGGVPGSSYVTSSTQTGVMFSPNGLTWTDYASNPILTAKSEDPYVVYPGDGNYYMYYEDKSVGDPSPGINRAISTDGVTFTPDTANNPVLTAGTGFDVFDVSSPVVWIEAGTWYMLYEGRSGAVDGNFGLATSSNGITWTKYAGNPVFTGTLAWDTKIQVVDDITKINGTYYVTYHGSATATPTVFSSGIVTSTNLITWTESAKNPYTKPNNGGMMFTQISTGKKYVINANPNDFLIQSNSTPCVYLQDWKFGKSATNVLLKGVKIN